MSRLEGIGVIDHSLPGHSEPRGLIEECRLGMVRAETSKRYGKL